MKHFRRKNMSAKWLHNAVFYEIYPQSFNDTNGDGIGDINGITEKLDYIKGLGCNAIWINPCFDSPFKDAGYDVRDFKKSRKDTAQMKICTGCLLPPMKKECISYSTWSPGTLPRNTNGSGRVRKRNETNSPTAISGPISASNRPTA